MGLSSSSSLRRFVWEIRFLKFLFRMVAIFINLRRLTGAQQVVRLRRWTSSSFSSPAPNIVKWKVLRRWGGDKTWVETGTYLGETTAFLSTFARIVYTLEPENSLFLRAAEKFKENSNVVMVGGSSEEKLLGLLNSFIYLAN
jgi:hypothetical protein